MLDLIVVKAIFRLTGISFFFKIMKIITKNKKAFFDYNVIDKLEAGIVLRGDEVKSLRAGQISLNGAFATFHQGELFLLNANIRAIKIR